MKKRKYNGWIVVDLDGTLAEYTGWRSADHIGKPIPLMVDRVKMWLSEGREVRIFTARVSPISAQYNGIELEEIVQIIREWSIKHIGIALPITHEKDFAMLALFDDIALYPIKRNTGLIITSPTTQWPEFPKRN